jgi:hypothetical protein
MTVGKSLNRASLCGFSEGDAAARRVSEVFTTDIPGAKPLDQRCPRLRSAHQTSRMNIENRQVHARAGRRCGQARRVDGRDRRVASRAHARADRRVSRTLHPPRRLGAAAGGLADPVSGRQRASIGSTGRRPSTISDGLVHSGVSAGVWSAMEVGEVWFAFSQFGSIGSIPLDAFPQPRRPGRESGLAASRGLFPISGSVPQHRRSTGCDLHP